MEQISIIFSRASSETAIFSKLIMATEGTQYSHVAIRMKDSETGQIVYYQASHTMVNEMSEYEFLSQETIIDRFDFQVDYQIKVAAKTFAINNLGVPYGVLSILGLALVQAAKWIGISIHNPFKQNGQTYVCSQFVATMLETVDGVNLPENIDDITPADLYPIVQNLPKVWNIVV
jgi:hypothetical protein